MDPEQRAQLAAALPTMTDAQLEDALQEFRTALVFSGEVGQAGENLRGLRDMTQAEITRRRSRSTRLELENDALCLEAHRQ
jgi:hypothetical protein